MKKNLLLLVFALLGSSVSAQQLSPQMEGFIDSVEAFVSTDGGRVIGILIAFAFFAVAFALWLSLLLFVVMFVFKFDALRGWFNRKAGVDIVYGSRLDKRLWRFALFFALIAASALLVSYHPNTIIFVAVAMLLYCIVRVRARVVALGSRKAAWLEIIYVLFSGYTMLLLCVFFFWAIIIFLGIKLLSESSSSGSSGGGSGYTCSSCIYHDSSEDWCTARKMRAYKGDSACGSHRLI